MLRTPFTKESKNKTPQIVARFSQFTFDLSINQRRSLAQNTGYQRYRQPSLTWHPYCN
jgi:hypothetical protein